MLRSDLIANLETVKPALSSAPVTPNLAHFWFTGRSLMAFNSTVGISIPFPTEFKGSVPSKLLDLLKVMGGGNEVDVINEDSSLVVRRLIKKADGTKKPGRSLIKLNMMPPEFSFKMPPAEFDDTDKGSIMDLIYGVEHCLISVSTGNLSPEHLGVTFEKEENGRISLFATDNSTIARASIRATNSLQVPKRAIVPTLFCNQMVRLYRAMSKEDQDNGRASFSISSRKVREEGELQKFAMFKAGSVVLYGQLIGTKTPLNFTSVLGYHLPKRFEDALRTFPSSLRGALERASIVCDEQRDSTKLKVERGRLFLESKTDNEEVHDDLPFKDHDDISVSVEPRLLRRASDFDEIMITKTCVILAKRKRGLLYLVSYQ